MPNDNGDAGQRSRQAPRHISVVLEDYLESIKPRPARLTFARLTADQRGAEVEPAEAE